MSKILYAASTYGHIKSFHLDYIQALRRDGHEVFVLACGEGADFDIPFEKRIFSRKNRECRKEIKKIISGGGFDAVLLNTTLAAFHIRMALTKKNRPRVVNIVHGYLFSEKSNIVKKCSLLFCEWILRKKTDTVIVMNKEDERIARKYKLASDIRLIYGMGVKSCEPSRNPSDVRSELSAFDTDYVITFVGELSKRKNQRMLISAMKEVKAKIPEAKLWLVGDGDERESLSALACDKGISDAVCFVGRRNDVPDIIAASDLYVSAAKSEGLPFNVAEAMAQKKMVLASNIKGHRDLIENAISGYLFSLDSERELVSLIFSAYEKRISLNGDEIYSAYEKYSYEKVFEKTYSLVKEALFS